MNNKTIVLIPYYNNLKGLLNTLNSIDSSEVIDLLIIDDGSHEMLNLKILEENIHFKGNVLIKRLESNCGIEVALNYGLELIKTINKHNFIARIDCGDLCNGLRFRIQQKFLENNNNIFLLGSNAIAIDVDGNEIYKTIFPEHHHQIKKRMFLNAMFLHPCVMFRIEVIYNVGKYPTKYKAAEDYAFFFSIVNQYTTHNLQDFLVKYEINPNGISLTKRKQQVISRIKIIIKHFYLGFWPIYGLFRNSLLLFMPNKFILFIKKNFT